MARKTAALSLMLLSIATALLNAASIDAYVRNVTGSVVSNATVKLYNASWQTLGAAQTDANGYVRFALLDYGTYNYEVSCIGDATEFWGSDENVSLQQPLITRNFTRNWPYKSGETLPANPYVGQQVQVKITVKNNLSYARNVKAELWVDRSKSSSWDCYELKPAQSVSGNGGTTTFTFDVTPNNSGTYYWKAHVLTYNDGAGGYIVTDTSGWNTAFPASYQTGSVVIYVENIGGTKMEGTEVTLDGDTVLTDSAGKARFPSIRYGDYNYEVRYDGAGGKEFWGNRSVTVDSSAKTDTYRRDWPYKSGETLPVNPYVGQQVQVKITVKNNLSYARNVKAELWVDRSKSSSWDFYELKPAQSVSGNGGTTTFTFDVTPNNSGTYYWKANVLTYNDGAADYIVTDTSAWATAFQASDPLLATGRIAYHSYSGYMAAPVDSVDGNAFVYQLDNNTLTNVTETLPIDNSMNPHFSPDGSRITFMAIPVGAARNRNSLEVYVYDLAEAQLTRLTSDAIPDEDPKFSPDGLAIVWKRNSQIWRMSSDGSANTQLTTTTDEKSGPNYCPDGSRIVYWSSSGQSADIWQMNADGSGASILVANASLQDYYPIYRDSNNVLYSRWESTSDHHDKVYNFEVSSGVSTRQAVNITGVEDADAAPVDTTCFLLSSTRTGGKGSYDVIVARYDNGETYTLRNANSAHQDLGACYSPYAYARKLKVQAPVSDATLATGASYTLQVRAYSDGDIWSGAYPSVTFQGPNPQTYSDLHDDGTGGDAIPGDGIYSRTIALPASSGIYTVTASAQSVEPGVTRQLSSASITVTLMPPDLPPTVTDVNSSKANGTYGTGTVIDVAVAFSEPVTVAGTPQLTLETGAVDAVVNYTSGSGTATLTFQYTVAAGHASADLDCAGPAALALNGGTIKDATGNNALLTLSAPGTLHSLGANKALVIDTGVPTVTDITSTRGNGTYGVGTTIDVTVTFSEPVTVTGTPQLTLETGAVDAVVAYTSGSGTATLTFPYAVAAGHTSADLDYAAMTSLALNGGTIKDAAGNNATLTLPAPGALHSLGANKGLVIDGIAPAVSLDVPSTTATRTGSVTYTVTYTGADSVTLAAGNITLNKTGTANGTVAVTGTGNTTRTVTISGITGDGTLGISLAAGTASDAAGNTAAAVGPSQTFIVDNTAPGISISAPSVASTRTGPVTYNITYTGADGVTLAEGNITLNKTGTANGTVAVTGTGNTTRTVTISGITGDGTLGISFAAGTASDTAGNTAPAVGPSQTFTVDNSAPSISISAPSATATRTGPVTYAVTYTGANSVTLAAGDITLNPTGTVNGAVAVGGTGTTTRTVTISNITGDGALGISIAAGTASDTAGNTALAVGPSQVFTVDNTGPTVGLSVPSTTATRGGPVTIAVTYTGADSVPLTAGSITLNKTGTANGTVAVTGTGTSTRTVTISGITGDGTLGISLAAGTASDTAGNTAPVAGPSQTFTVDNTGPGVSMSAPSATATRAGPVIYTVSYTGADTVTLAAGSIPLNKTGTANGTVAVTGTGTSTRTVTISGITGDGTLGISLAEGTASDTAGNTAPAAGPSPTFTVDNTGPGVLISAPSETAIRAGPVTYTVTYTGASAVTLLPANVTLNPAGTASGTVAVSGTGSATRTVTISGITGNGTLGISIAAGTASDGSGNSAPAAGPSQTFIVDNAPPSGTITINSGVAYTSLPQVTLSLSANDGTGASGVSGTRFSNDGTTWSAWEPFAAAKAWTLLTGAGLKTVRVQYRDYAGNTPLTLSDSITLVSRLTVTALSRTGLTGLTATLSCTVSLAATEYAVMEGVWNPANAEWEPITGGTTSSSGRTFPCTFDLQPTVGAHRVYVAVRNAGLGLTSAARSLSVTLTGPAVYSLSTTKVSGVTATLAITVTGSPTQFVIMEDAWNAGTAVWKTIPAGTIVSGRLRFPADYTLLATAGTHTLYVAVRDPVTGIISTPRSIRVTLAAPTVTSMTPASGPAGSAVVTLTGRAFGPTAGGAAKIEFGGVPSEIQTWSNTSVRCVVPATAPLGAVNVVLTTSAGLQAAPRVFTVLPFWYGNWSGTFQDMDDTSIGASPLEHGWMNAGTTALPDGSICLRLGTSEILTGPLNASDGSFTLTGIGRDGSGLTLTGTVSVDSLTGSLDWSGAGSSGSRDMALGRPGAAAGTFSGTYVATVEDQFDSRGRPAIPKAMLLAGSQSGGTVTLRDTVTGEVLTGPRLGDVFVVFSATRAIYGHITSVNASGQVAAFDATYDWADAASFGWGEIDAGRSDGSTGVSRGTTLWNFNAVTTGGSTLLPTAVVVGYSNAITVTVSGLGGVTHIARGKVYHNPDGVGSTLVARETTLTLFGFWNGAALDGGLEHQDPAVPFDSGDFTGTPR